MIFVESYSMCACKDFWTEVPHARSLQRRFCHEKNLDLIAKVSLLFSTIKHVTCVCLGGLDAAAGAHETDSILFLVKAAFVTNNTAVKRH